MSRTLSAPRRAGPFSCDERRSAAPAARWHAAPQGLAPPQQRRRPVVWPEPGRLSTKASSQQQQTDADFVVVPWDVERETWDEEAEARMQALVDRFKSADLDGNGVIDREELRRLLERVGDGEDQVPMHWLTDQDISEVMAQYDTNGDGVISFEEFVRMSQDKIFLTGKLQEYRQAFRAVDAGGNGSVSATELYQLFQKLGNPISYEKLVKIMEAYDHDQSGTIDFSEFLRMFRDELLDLQQILDYIKQRTAEREAAAARKAAAAAAAAGSTAAVQPPKLAPGAVHLFFSEEEFDAALAANRDKLVVVMASVTWCKPCKGFQESYEAAARHYDDALFLKFFGNSNESTKALFKDRLKARTTPSFFFFRAGKVVGQCSGAVAKRVETQLRQAYGTGGPKQPFLWLTEEDLAAAT